MSADSSLELDIDMADALDAQIRIRPNPRQHDRTKSDTSASSFVLSLPPEGLSLLRSKMAFPESDAEPDADVPLVRQRSHAVLDDFDSSFEEGVAQVFESSPTLVLNRQQRGPLGLESSPTARVSAKNHAANQSLTETELSASPTSARSLKLRPEHEALFDSDVDS